MSKLNIKRDDTVIVLTGKDKGKKGKVMKGGRIAKEGTIDASNVMLICPSCKKPTRVGHIFEDGKKYRACKKCGKKID